MFKQRTVELSVNKLKKAQSIFHDLRKRKFKSNVYKLLEKSNQIT